MQCTPYALTPAETGKIDETYTDSVLVNIRFSFRFSSLRAPMVSRVYPGLTRTTWRRGRQYIRGDGTDMGLKLPGGVLWERKCLVLLTVCLLHFGHLTDHILKLVYSRQVTVTNCNFPVSFWLNVKTIQLSYFKAAETLFFANIKQLLARMWRNVRIRTGVAQHTNVVSVTTSLTTLKQKELK